jgi:ubiquitin-like modifier-activating enzyme 5
MSNSNPNPNPYPNNRLFYTPNQVGLSKVEAAGLTLAAINPSTIIETYNGNITVGGNPSSNKKIRLLQPFGEFNPCRGHGWPEGQLGSELRGQLRRADGYKRRILFFFLNGAKLCNIHDQIWFESGVSEDALSCHYQIMIPGETACFACMPPLALVEDNEADIKREGVCAASLPTTMVFFQ